MVNKGDIKEAAVKLFADKGYEGTTMQNIAEAVGLQKQSLYTHFKSKDELYLEVIRDQIESFNNRIDGCLEKLSREPTELLLAGVFKCLVTLFSCRERLLIWKRTLIDHGSAANTDASSEIECNLEKKLRSGLYKIISERHERLSDEQSFKVFYITYILAIQGYLDLMVLGLHSDSLWESVWHYCWYGLRAAI